MLICSLFIDGLEIFLFLSCAYFCLTRTYCAFKMQNSLLHTFCKYLISLHSVFFVLSMLFFKTKDNIFIMQILFSLSRTMLSKNIMSMCICVYVYLCLCDYAGVPHICMSPRYQERMSDPLQLKLQLVMSCLGCWEQNYQTISLVLHHVFDI